MEQRARKAGKTSLPQPFDEVRASWSVGEEASRTRAPFEIGDWVIVDDDDKGMMRGYIVDTNLGATRLTICITETENTAYAPFLLDDVMHYQQATFRAYDCKNVTNDLDMVYAEQGYVENMLDFALITGDRELFKEMCIRLQAVRKAEAS